MSDKEKLKLIREIIKDYYDMTAEGSDEYSRGYADAIMSTLDRIVRAGDDAVRAAG